MSQLRFPLWHNSFSREHSGSISCFVFQLLFRCWKARYGHLDICLYTFVQVISQRGFWGSIWLIELLSWHMSDRQVESHQSLLEVLYSDWDLIEGFSWRYQGFVVRFDTELSEISRRPKLAHGLRFQFVGIFVPYLTWNMTQRRSISMFHLVVSVEELLQFHTKRHLRKELFLPVLSDSFSRSNISSWTGVQLQWFFLLRRSLKGFVFSVRLGKNSLC